MSAQISVNDYDKPKFPTFKALVYTIAYGLSASPALYDGFFNKMDNEIIGYVLSVLTGLTLAVAIAWGIMSGYEYSKHRFAFYGGIAVSMALAALRFWAAGDSGWGILLAIALFLFEIGIVFFCEDTASGLHTNYQNWLVVKGNKDKQAALLDVARRRVERTQMAIAEFVQKIAVRTEHIKDRISRSGQIEPLKKLAVCVVIDGYQAGLAEIEGRFHVNWKVEDVFPGGKK